MFTALWTRSDEQVVRRVLAGRHDDFGVLVKRYLPAVMAVTRGILRNPADIEDVSQECFITAYQKLDTLLSPEKFPAWLLRITRNSALNWQRRTSSEVPLTADMVELLHDVSPEPEKAEMHEMLHHALDRLDMETRELLLLHYYGGYSLREIAGMYGITRMAAAKRLQRARETLGGEFLKLMPEAMPPKAMNSLAKKVSAAAIAAGFAWSVKPAHGMMMGFTIAVAKLACVGVAVVATAVASLFVAPSVLGWTPDLPAARAATVSPAASVAKPVQPPTESSADAPADLTPPAKEEPTFPLSNVLVTPLDQVIGNATVMAERITWNAWELPPDETEVWTTTANANGVFTFEALPPGGYSVTAITSMLGGAHDFRVMENGQIRGPRNVKMYPVISSYGLLLDSAGAPVSDAAIYPISHEMFARQEFDHVTVCGLRARSDAEGRFMFKGIIPGAWKLYVIAPNRKPFYTDYVPCYGLRTTVVIEEPGTVRGRITNVAGNAAPGLKGTIRAGRSLPTYDDYQPRYRVENAFVSDAEGRFELPEVAPGVYTFDIDDPALVLKDPGQRIEVASARTQEVELRVISGGTIYGHVLNAKTAEGIPNVTLSAYSRSAGDSVEKRCITGETGDYIFTGLPEGSFVIYTRTDDSFLDSSRELPPVQVKLGETIENKDILLNPAFMLSGRVVDSLENPVTAQVNASGDNVYKSTVARADGTFALPLPDKARVSIWAWTDYARSEKVQIVPSESTDEPVVLKLTIAAGGSIEGCVQDMQGKPVYNARVQAYTVNTDLANPSTDGGNAVTNATGEFRIFGLTPGRYTISAQTQIGKELGQTLADVVQNTPTRNVLIQEKPEGTLTIRGSVCYPSGLPCPVAALGLNNQQLIAAGPMGGFEFTQLGEGNYTIYALSPGYSPVVMDGVAAGSRDVRIVLQNFAILMGNVVDKTTGKPVTSFSVRYVMQSYPPFDTAGVEGGEESFANSDGSFRIEKAPVAPLNVEIRAEGYAFWNTTISDPVPGQENVVNAELSAAATITGVIVDTAGNPIASAEVIGNHMNVRSDGTGHFEIPGLPLGQESKIVVMHSSYAQAVVNIAPDSSEPLEIVLVKGGSVRIKATEAGRPVLMFSAMVSAQGDASTPRPARRMATNVGEVLIERFPPGEVDVTVYIPTQDQKVEEFGKAVVTVIDGQETEVEVGNTP